MMARQSMRPSQAYGNSAIGASPAITSKQKSNLATASGAMGKGSSRTLAIQWTFGPDAQPDINNPLTVMDAWLRFVDSGEISHRALTKAWHLCYADLQHVVATGPLHVWQGVSLAMTTTILHLIQLHIKPIGPTLWMRGDTDDMSDTPIPMDLRNLVDRALQMKSIKNRLAQEVWQNVSPHQANGGLWDGEPADFARTKAIHHRLLANGKIDEANALRAVVTHNVWYAQRATKDTDLRMCPRCGEEEESVLHRHWTCKNNEL